MGSGRGQPGGSTHRGPSALPPVRNICTPWHRPPGQVCNKRKRRCKCPDCTLAPVPQARAKQSGQTTVFFALILTGLLLLTSVGIEIGRIVYARGEVGKAADAAALAAAARIDVPYYRETGEIRFLADARATAQNFASMNSTFLRNRHIGVTVTGISVNSSSRQVTVTVAADMSFLIPAILPFHGVYSVTGYAEARVGKK
jgi:Flp pilus assembly protein TadG